MHRAEDMADVVKQRSDAMAIGDVAGYTKVLVAMSVQFSRKLGQTALVDVAGHHRGSVCGIVQGNGAAQATGSAGDDGHLARDGVGGG